MAYPIETAPRDGRVIIAGDDHGTIAKVFWHRARRREGPRLLCGMWVYATADGDIQKIDFTPTRWGENTAEFERDRATERTNMEFGRAIEALKAGSRVARAGWNGKGMFIYLNRGSFDGDSIPRISDELPAEIDSIRRELFDYGTLGTVTRLPNINMRSATGATVTGWLASQTDILAEDWMVLTAENEAEAV